MILRLLNRLEEFLIGVFLALGTCVVFLAVVHRALATIPWAPIQERMLAINVSWAQELCIYLFVWMAKFGAAYGVRTGIHVGVDVLINRLPPLWHRTFIYVGLCAGALFTGVIGTLGARFVWGIGQTDQVSADLEVPMWLVYLAIPLGSYLMCFRFVQVMVGFWRTGEVPHHDVHQVAGLEETKGSAL